MKLESITTRTPARGSQSSVERHAPLSQGRQAYPLTPLSSTAAPTTLATRHTPNTSRSPTPVAPTSFTQTSISHQSSWVGAIFTKAWFLLIGKVLAVVGLVGTIFIAERQLQFQRWDAHKEFFKDCKERAVRCCNPELYSRTDHKVTSLSLSSACQRVLKEGLRPPPGEYKRALEYSWTLHIHTHRLAILIRDVALAILLMATLVFTWKSRTLLLRMPIFFAEQLQTLLPGVFVSQDTPSSSSSHGQTEHPQNRRSEHLHAACQSHSPLPNVDNDTSWSGGQYEDEEDFHREQSLPSRASLGWWLIPGDGIAEEVIQENVQRFLGPEATVSASYHYDWPGRRVITFKLVNVGYTNCWLIDF